MKEYIAAKYSIALKIDTFPKGFFNHRQRLLLVRN